MASTFSTNLKIELQTTGENSGTWGTITNTNLGTALEQAIVGYGNPSYASDANLTLTYTDTNAAQTARALVLNVTSAVSLTGTRELVVPTIQKQYIVQNNTTGSQSITVKTSGGTGVTVPNGRKAHLYVNGTDVIYMDDYVDINGGAIDGTPIGANSASTGAFTTLAASGNVTLSGGTANGVLYLNGSKVATSGSALQFSGTKLSLSAAGGADFVGVFTNTTAATPYILRIQEPATPASGYPLLDVVNNAGSTAYLRVDSGTGNVGIGASSPAGKLDIRSASGSGNTVLMRGGTYTDILYSTGIRFLQPASTLNANRQFRFTSGDNSLTLQGTDGAGTDAADTNLILQPSGGNVGIGTASPSNKLTVQANDVFNQDSSGQIVIKGSSNTAKNLRIGFDTTSDYGYIQAIESGVATRSLALQQFGGNVGIGTASPGFKLDVQGSATDFVAFNGLNTNNSAGTITSSAIKFGFTSTVGTHYATLKITEDSANSNSGGLTISLPNGGVETPLLALTSAGNLGIGTTSPAYKLDVERSGDGITAGIAGGTYGIRFDNGGTFSSGASTIHGVDSTLTTSYQQLNLNGSVLTFQTSATERARITAGGYFKASNTGTYVGSTSSYHELRSDANSQTAFITNTNSAYTSNLIQAESSTTAGSGFNLIRLFSDGVAQFQVRGDGVVFAQNTTIQSISDARLKENVRNASDGLNVINALRPVRYDWKEGFGNDRKNQLGFIAQEVETVFPDAVSEWAAKEGDEAYKTVGPAALIPVLVKAIQELSAKVAALEAK
jgi:hypothetical protein